MTGMDYHLTDLELRYYVLKLAEKIDPIKLELALHAHNRHENKELITGEQLAKLIQTSLKKPLLSSVFPTMEEWRQLEDCEYDDCPKCHKRVDWHGYFKTVTENEPDIEFLTCSNCGYARDA